MVQHELNLFGVEQKTKFDDFKTAKDIVPTVPSNVPVDTSTETSSAENTSWKDPAFMDKVLAGKLLVIDLGANKGTFYDGTPVDFVKVEIISDKKKKIVYKFDPIKVKGKTVEKTSEEEVRDGEVIYVAPPKKRGQRVIVGDKEKAHAKRFKVSAKYILNDLLPQYAGYAVVVEDAHMAVPKGPTSLAQFFTKQELTDFYDLAQAHGCSLRFYPQKLTPATLSAQKIEKDDLYDPIAIHRSITERAKSGDDLHFKKPRYDFGFSSKKKEAHVFCTRGGKALNYTRAFEKVLEHTLEQHADGTFKIYLGKPHIFHEMLRTLLPRVVEHKFYAERNGETHDVSDMVRDCFNIVSVKKYKEEKRRNKNSKIKCSFRTQNRQEVLKEEGDKEGLTSRGHFAGDVNFTSSSTQLPTLFTLLSCFVGQADYNEETSEATILPVLRKRGPEDNRMTPSWNWAKENYFILSSHHHKGGVAASNVKHWGCKSYVSRKMKEKFGEKNLPSDRTEWSKEQVDFFKKHRNFYYHTALKLMFNFFKEYVETECQHFEVENLDA